MKDKYQDKYRVPTSRATWWNYENAAPYFITICTYAREHFFGTITNEKLQISEIGKMAISCWEEIPLHFPGVDLGEFIVMPNHIHGILHFNSPKADASYKFEAAPLDMSHLLDVETLHATSLHPTPPRLRSPHASPPPPSENDTLGKNEKMSSISPKPGSLSVAIRSYKSAVTKLARACNPNFGWQARFHDHIIRNQSSYETIENYIKNNIAKWEDDCFYRK